MVIGSVKLSRINLARLPQKIQKQLWEVVEPACKYIYIAFVELIGYTVLPRRRHRLSIHNLGQHDSSKIHCSVAGRFMLSICATDRGMSRFVAELPAKWRDIEARYAGSLHDCTLQYRDCESAIGRRSWSKLFTALRHVLWREASSDGKQKKYLIEEARSKITCITDGTGLTYMTRDSCEAQADNIEHFCPRSNWVTGRLWLVLNITRELRIVVKSLLRQERTIREF